MEQIKKYSNFKEELLNKEVVVGLSAGVCFLSERAFSSSRDYVYECLGILPIKSNCHYKKEKDLSWLDDLNGELLRWRRENIG